MSPSSTGDSPLSATAPSASIRQFPLPARDNFTIDVSSAMSAGLNGNGNGNGIGNGTNSPANLKAQRTPSFSRDGLFGGNQKARHLSQVSEAMSNGIVPREPSDDGINPLKRRNTDVGIDYPRRRATIAVSDAKALEAQILINLLV